MLRFQQYIELVRTQEEAKLLEAIAHAKAHLLVSKDIYPREVQQAAGLLAFPPGTKASVYNVSDTQISIHGRVLTMMIRNYIARTAGIPSRISSCRHIMLYSHYHQYHSYILHFLLVFPLSRHHHATLQPPRRRHLLLPRSQLLCVQYAVQN